MINFYRDLYPTHAATLASLTGLCGHKRNFKWEVQHEQVFQRMKEIIAQDIMLTYPQFNKPFHMYTDASKSQIGGIIMQDNFRFFQQEAKSKTEEISSNRARIVSHCGNNQVLQAHATRSQHSSVHRP